MVKVREDRPMMNDGQLDTSTWVNRLCQTAELSSEYVPLLTQAAQITAEVENLPGDSLTGWGEGYSSFPAGLEMAEILAELKLDGDTLVAAILYRSVREAKLQLKDLKDNFGDMVVKLIKGVIRMAAISNLSNHTGNTVMGLEGTEQADNVRKMLVAMVDDVRVALIKLAERTCAIRAVKNAPIEKRQKVAREVSDIYAPLAHRLGIGHIKWELEDLAFRYLHPYDYKYIAKLLDEKRLDRQTYIDQVIDTLHTSLAKEGLNNVHIYGRAKHIYSIWRKMRRKNIGFSEVYDIRAVRILVESEQDCYRVLGIVHSLWRNIPHEFDDYIANPKENGYRSLHTAVSGPSNRVLEVQIRTHNMHDEAEFGVCAHWRYKHSDKETASSSYEQKIEWLRQVLEWHDEIGGTPWDDHLLRGIEQDRIYLFTPDGHVVDLPEGATPVDFAFRIHSDIGLRCKGAKVNSRIVPLNQPLKTADQIEILTGNRESPSRDWLLPSLGYTTTSKARSRLQAWFKLQDREQNISDGRAILDREFMRLAVSDIDFGPLIDKLNVKSLDDLYAGVGTGDLSVDRIANVAQRLFKPESAIRPTSLVGRAKSDGGGGADVYINGVGNLMSHMAACCKPIPGDSITGYITVGRGVAIHRQDCSNALQHGVDDPERMIAVEWANEPQKVYSVDVTVEAFDRNGLLRDITALLDKEDVNVSAMQTLSNKNKNTVDMSLTIEVTSFSDLSRVLARLDRLPNISRVQRSG